MFLDRQDNRKEVQQAYRKQLKQQLQNKRSRVISNKDYRPQNGAFSLIVNIEKEQNQRKKKNEQYYDDLRTQMEAQKREKQQQQAQKKRKQLQQENKIKQQQRKLQERYQEEIKKENKNKKNAQPRNDPPPQIKKKKDLSISREMREPLKKETSQNQIRASNQRPNFFQSPQSLSYGFQPNIEPYSNPPSVNLYPNKIQNETFNYASRKVYKDNYYKQLLGQRRLLQEQANQISQLNRIFNSERFKRRQESRGLQELRNLQKLLDSKNMEYLDTGHDDSKGFASSSSSKVRPLNKIQRASIFSQKGNKDEWRKLD